MREKGLEDSKRRRKGTHRRREHGVRIIGNLLDALELILMLHIGRVEVLKIRVRVVRFICPDCLGFGGPCTTQCVWL